MGFISERISIIKEAIEALPNFEWTSCGNSIQNTTEFENMMDNVSEQIQELKRFSTQKEVFDELDTLRGLFYDYSTLTASPSEQEKVRKTMMESVDKLKKDFQA